MAVETIGANKLFLPARPESTPSSELAHIIRLSCHQAPSPPIGELEFTARRACSWISRLIKYFTGGQHLWQRLEVTSKPNTKAGSESGVFSVTPTPGYLFLPERETTTEPTYIQRQVSVTIGNTWKSLRT